MKKIIYMLFATVLFGVASCEKEIGNDVKLVQAGEIKYSVNQEVKVLSKENEDKVGLVLSIEKPQLGVNTPILYNIIFSYKDNNEKVSATSLSKSFTVKELNEIGQKLEVEAGNESEIAIKVNGTVGKEYTLDSKEQKIVLTTYKGVLLPEFYLVGGATSVGWASEKAIPLYNQGNLHVIYTYLQKDQPFRFLGQQNWSPKNYSIDEAGIKDDYKFFKKVSSVLVKDGEENMKFIGETGIYKVEINKEDKSLTIEKTNAKFDAENVYLVGSFNDWKAENPFEMVSKGNGVFEYSLDLKKCDAFKFIGQKSFGDIEWGNINAKGNSGYIAPKGVGQDIVFSGKDGKYKITIDIKAGTYTIL